jgi:hypothetical protein
MFAPSRLPKTHVPFLLFEEISVLQRITMVSFAVSKNMSSPDTHLQLKTETVATEKRSLVVQFGDEKALDHLTNPSLIHLSNRLGDFAVQVLREARSIETTEHVGSGPPEITAAHIDEAWWVSRRRIRRSKHPILGVIIRVMQAFGIAGFGVGISFLKTTWWGAWVFAGCTLGTFLAFLLEVYVQRTE